MSEFLQIVNLMENILLSNTQLFTREVNVLWKCNKELLCMNCLLSLGSRKQDIESLKGIP